jgi:hypothetical protein
LYNTLYKRQLIYRVGEKCLKMLVARERVGQDSRHKIPLFPAIVDLGVWRQSSFDR